MKKSTVTQRENGDPYISKIYIKLLDVVAIKARDLVESIIPQDRQELDRYYGLMKAFEKLDEYYDAIEADMSNEERRVVT